jgi:hypothetical protein
LARGTHRSIRPPAQRHPNREIAGVDLLSALDVPPAAGRSDAADQLHDNSDPCRRFGKRHAVIGEISLCARRAEPEQFERALGFALEQMYDGFKDLEGCMAERASTFKETGRKRV